MRMEQDLNSRILTKSSQAKVTHNTTKAILSAQTIALINHYFLYNKGEKKHLKDYLWDIQKYKWNGDWVGEVGMDAIETVEAVITLILEQSTLKGILKAGVDFGGDVDTVASLGLALGSSCQSIEDDLPGWLFDELEDGNYGKTYINNLDSKLMKLKS